MDKGEDVFVEEEEMDNGIFRSELSQVATCSFLSEPFFAFVRFQKLIVLKKFCEIDKPTS